MSSTSSTARSDRRAPKLLLLFAGLLLVLTVLHTTLSALADWAEIEKGHYLWRKEEWLQLLIPGNYVGRGRNRILLTGASEAREGLLVERFDEAFPDRRAYQSSLSMGTMDGLLLLLEYLEHAYGEEAMPRVLVVGVTPRFIFDDPPVDQTPIHLAIERYSPYFKPAGSSHDIHLVKAHAGESLLARLRFLFKQGRRYRSALKAAIVAIIETVSDSGGPPSLSASLRPYKYHGLPPMPKEDYAKHFAKDPDPWSLAKGEAAIRADADRLQQLCRRHGIELYIVAFPEGEWLERSYQPDFQRSYLALYRDAYRDAVVLDLTDLLTTDEFFDHTHPTREGAERITALVIQSMKSSGIAAQ